MTAKNLYAYTLQPVNYEISEAEQRQAQLAIWRSTNKIGTKAWIIMAAVALLSIVGIILLKNYSTIFCWVALVCVLAYFLIRKFGLEWYVKRKMNEFPVQEIKGIRLGVQPHGIIMRQQMGAQEGVGAIGWKDIYEWYDTAEFILVKQKISRRRAISGLNKPTHSNSPTRSTNKKAANSAKS